MKMVGGERMWGILDQQCSVFSNPVYFVFAFFLYSLFFTDSRTKFFALPNLGVSIKFQTQCENDPPAMASLQTADRKEIQDAISTGV